MTNLDSIFKSRVITLSTKVHLVKAMVFSVVMYGCGSWTIKKAEHRRIDAFELWCWRRLLRVPWTVRRSKESILKEISPEFSLERLMLKLKLQYFGHLMQRTLVPTGLFMEIPEGYEGQVRPRSGLAIKNGITVLNTPGTIDADYRGEVKIILINLSDTDFTINSGERVAQIVFAKCAFLSLCQALTYDPSQAQAPLQVLRCKVNSRYPLSCAFPDRRPQ